VVVLPWAVSVVVVVLEPFAAYATTPPTTSPPTTPAPIFRKFLLSGLPDLELPPLESAMPERDKSDYIQVIQISVVYNARL